MSEVSSLAKRLREVTGLHAFAELFGFDWDGKEDWTWHDVACAMADAMDATVRSDAMLRAKVKAQSKYIDKLRGEYKALDEQMERRCAEYRDTIRTLKPGLDAATVGTGTCKDLGGVGADGEDVFNCSECGCVLSLYDGEGVNTLCTSFIYDYPRFCPECGRRIIVEEDE